MDIKECKQIYSELKPCEDWIANIDKKLFFDFAKTLIDAYEKESNKNSKYVANLTDEQYRKLVDIIRAEINQEWIDKIKNRYEQLKHYDYIELGELLKLIQEKE